MKRFLWPEILCVKTASGSFTLELTEPLLFSSWTKLYIPPSSKHLRTNLYFPSLQIILPPGVWGGPQPRAAAVLVTLCLSFLGHKERTTHFYSFSFWLPCACSVSTNTATPGKTSRNRSAWCKRKINITVQSANSCRFGVRWVNAEEFSSRVFLLQGIS